MTKRLMALHGRSSRSCSRRASPSDAATMTTTVATAPRAAAAATSARSPRASCWSVPTRRIPPFEIGQPPDISGFDIEVMDAIAEDLGVEATYQDTGFDTIFRDTANGQFDTAAAASTITPERQQKVNFTDPYYEAQQALVVAEDDDEIVTTADLGGKIVGAQDGTTGEALANDETDASEVRRFPGGHRRDHGAGNRPGRSGDRGPAGGGRRGREAGWGQDRRGDPAARPRSCSASRLRRTTRHCSTR